MRPYRAVRAAGATLVKMAERLSARAAVLDEGDPLVTAARAATAAAPRLFFSPAPFIDACLRQVTATQPSCSLVVPYRAMWRCAVIALTRYQAADAITAVNVDYEPLEVVIDPYKAPKSVIVVDSLPRTSTGKIQKNVVRERFAEHYE